MRRKVYFCRRGDSGDKEDLIVVVALIRDERGVVYEHTVRAQRNAIFTFLIKLCKNLIFGNFYLFLKILAWFRPTFQ